MSEPTRKRNKANAAISSSQLSLTTPSAKLSFWTQRSDGGVFADFTEFAAGNRKDDCGKWNGPFHGRPKLIGELFPHIELSYSNLSASTINGLKVALRRWWRLFDECSDLAPVEQAMDINDIHAALARKSGIEQGASAKLISLLNAYRRSNGFVQMYWVSYQGRAPQSELPATWEIKEIHNALKRKYLSTLDGWLDSDTCAAKGVNWAAASYLRPALKSWEASEIHATYRGIAAITGNPCPPKTLAISTLGLKFCKAFDQMAIPVYGLYPSKSEVQVFLLLFLLRTGWNPQTALDIDATTSFLEDHPVSPMFHVIRSVKERSGTEQVAVGAKKSVLSPGNIVLKLVERTRPLRDVLVRQLETISRELESNPENHELRQQLTNLRASVKSPWLFCTAKSECKILALTSNTYHTANGGGFLKVLISQINAGRAPGSELNSSITASDFRDAYIAFAYRNSGYSWLAAKIAAGHKSVESLKHYLRQKQWKAHSRGQVLHFTEKLWTEIQDRRVVDPAVLHALVQRGDVSEQQRLRWAEHRDRTRVGVGCLDFRNPPKAISPEHKAGTGCRIQRCTLCPNAVVFPDSLDHLARRQAELEYLHINIPLVAWTESNFDDELAATQGVLAQLDRSAVAVRVEFWETEIDQGRHLVFGLEGAYA